MRRVPLLLIGTCWLAACGGSPTEPAVVPGASPAASATPATETTDDAEVNALFVDPSKYDFSRNPELVGRIAETPHRYFRFINLQFSRAVCERHADAMRSMPEVTLHGDAHLEQYAVTDLGRGLTDLDDSSHGPAIMDLSRFGASIYIAARQNGWQDRGDALFEKFLDGYEAGLNEPNLVAPAPALARRFQSGFTSERAGFLKYAESVMRPIESDPAVKKEDFEKTVGQYVSHMQEHRGDLPAGFFDVKRAGVLKVGIGSALDRKFLLRVQGPTPAVDDDVILELKEVRKLSEIPCVAKRIAEHGSAMVPAKPTGAYQPEYHLGSVALPNNSYWVHEWSANYKELKVHKSLQAPEELAEVVFDVGVQLGRVHAGNGEADGAQRKRHVEVLKQVREPLHRDCVAMANDTYSAWRAFKLTAESAGLLATEQHASND